MRKLAIMGLVALVGAVGLVATGKVLDRVVIPAADYSPWFVTPTHLAIRIHNTTGKTLNVFGLTFDGCVEVASAFTVKGPAILKVEGGCGYWRVVLAGAGLPSTGYLYVSVKLTEPAKLIRVWGFQITPDQL